ncbi:LysM peptidoglycan-binding domain-containing protein [Fundidesulfovibrio terrae]|uniref:LysM peptidoglycan-binding domain-containing protein n=1 Tax=Fundidesulfovibrio terrae TaxID=2922866 RepID=UPI001FAF84BD|nr:LysM peptidoglycan-binding domain-containing protein [Fundidesulfovibrio terrae]
MVKPIIAALTLSLTLTGCGLLGGDKPEPAPVAQVNPEPAPPPPPPPPPPLTHTVKKGESVAVIAKKFGVPAGELMAANKLANAKAIKAGMVLTIPGKTAEPATPKPVSGKEPAQENEPKAAKGSKGDPYGVEAATAPTKGKGKKGGKFVDDDATYEKVKTDFHEYARKWLEKSTALAQNTKDRKEVKMEDGRYVASYSVILPDTMQTEVKRVQYDDTPYVGHITYQVEVHRTYGPTPQAATAATNEEVKQESMREIFSYSGQKRAWR